MVATKLCSFPTKNPAQLLQTNQQTQALTSPIFQSPLSHGTSKHSGLKHVSVVYELAKHKSLIFALLSKWFSNHNSEERRRKFVKRDVYCMQDPNNFDHREQY